MSDILNVGGTDFNWESPIPGGVIGDIFLLRLRESLIVIGQNFLLEAIVLFVFILNIVNQVFCDFRDRVESLV